MLMATDMVQSMGHKLIIGNNTTINIEPDTRTTLIDCLRHSPRAVPASQQHGTPIPSGHRASLRCGSTSCRRRTSRRSSLRAITRRRGRAGASGCRAAAFEVLADAGSRYVRAALSGRPRHALPRAIGRASLSNRARALLI